MTEIVVKIGTWFLDAYIINIFFYHVGRLVYQLAQLQIRLLTDHFLILRNLHTFLPPKNHNLDPL